MPTDLFLTIADIPVALEWSPPISRVKTPPAYRPFLSSGRAGTRLRLSTATQHLDDGIKAFESPPIWSLYRSPSGLSFHIYDAYPDLRRTLFIPPAGRDARLDFSGSDWDPFAGPAMELLLITVLADCEGVVLHGCGIDAGGRGIVFAGESGAGKTTLSRLWFEEEGGEILSDDRVIVRRQDGGFRLYGTPWHGEACFAAPGGVPLERIYFIRHGRRNHASNMSAAGVVRELLKCSFPPFWDASGMRAALEFFDALAGAVPCEELSFTPERAVIDFVLSSALRRAALPYRQQGVGEAFSLDDRGWKAAPTSGT